MDTPGSLDTVEDVKSDIKIIDSGTDINEVELNENVPNEYIPSKVKSQSLMEEIK